MVELNAREGPGELPRQQPRPPAAAQADQVPSGRGHEARAALEEVEQGDAREGCARGALEPLRRAHGALLEVLLDDASADGWWAPLDATRDAAFFAESSDEESGGAKRKSKRKAAHPWARVTRRFSRAAQARLAADDVDLLREADDDADASPDGLNAAVEAIVKDLRRGAEADADTRRWVGAVRRALAAHVDLLAQLRAVSLKRRTVDRAEARGVARDLFATRGAEVSA